MRYRRNAPKGQKHISPGQSDAATPQSVALGTEMVTHRSPEGAEHQARINAQTLNESSRYAGVRSNVSPFQGLDSHRLPTQGGATRLRPFTLPWAGMSRPLRGKERVAHSANLYSSMLTKAKGKR